MAETLDRAIRNLISADPTPDTHPKNSFANIPDDAWERREITLSLSRAEYAALSSKIGALGTGQSFEAWVREKTTLLEPALATHSE